MSRHADVIVIGGGLLGCFLARALRRYELSVLVLEKEADVCTGISKANSGIIYPGYDMAPGSLKARLTVQASQNFPSLCRDLSVPLNRCGSLMAGWGPRAAENIRRKYHQGQENGVSGLMLLNDQQCHELEPLLAEGITQGLFAPETASVIPWDLGIAAFENASANGAEFLFRQEVIGIERQHTGFLVHAGEDSFSCRTLFNCAGMQSAAVHELLSPPSVRIRPSAADYVLLSAADPPPVSHVIFHEPEEKGKGLTLVPTPDGTLLVGPTKRPVRDYDRNGIPGCPTDKNIRDGISGCPTDENIRDGISDCPADESVGDEINGCPTGEDAWDELKQLCRRIVPGLPLSPVLRSFGAVRPNPQSVRLRGAGWIFDDRPLNDFQILDEDGFYSLIGIKTPGLTCCAELGELLARRLTEKLGSIPLRRDFDPTRPAPPKPHLLSDEERSALAAARPEYGEILCTCRDVTAGEIRDAVRRGAVTLDGVKRRTGAMMGFCQGSRCMKEILEEIAAERHCRPQDIEKEYRGSEILERDERGNI